MKAESYNNEQRALSATVQSLGVLITGGVAEYVWFGWGVVGWEGEGIATAIVNAPATGPVCSPLRSDLVNIIVELINLFAP